MHPPELLDAVDDADEATALVALEDEALADTEAVVEVDALVEAALEAVTDDEDEPAPPAELVDAALEAWLVLLVLPLDVDVVVSAAETAGPVGVLSSVVPAAQPPDCATRTIEDKATAWRRAAWRSCMALRTLEVRRRPVKGHAKHAATGGSLAAR